MLLSPPEIEEKDWTKFIFLAGPIQGAQDWQERAALYLNAREPELIIASPRKEYQLNEFDHMRQVDWESFHLQKASQFGLVVFWLAKEFEHHPHRAYAQTTRFELGEHFAIKKQKPDTRLVVGIESGFSGGRYITHRLSEIGVVPQSSLEETLDSAIRGIKS